MRQTTGTAAATHMGSGVRRTRTESAVQCASRRILCALRPARNRQLVVTEDSARDHWVHLAQPTRSTRCQPPAMPLARRTCRGQAGAPPATWPKLGAAAAHPTAPSCAAARRIRALPPGWRARRAMLRHQRSRRQACEPRSRRPGDSRAGLTRCDGGKSHLLKGATHRHQCKSQRSGERDVLPGQALRVRLGVSLQQVMPAAPPGAGARSRLVDRYIVLLRCCILLLYEALGLWAQDFEFVSLTWVELRGFEPLTSCMPSAGSTSIRVYRRRSPSQSVPTGSARSAPVAVLSCCTGQPSRPGPRMSA